MPDSVVFWYCLAYLAHTATYQLAFTYETDSHVIKSLVFKVLENGGRKKGERNQNKNFWMVHWF